ncbi:MAG: hypothetical protein H6685_01945 [Deltaproteobacteria bacterium]|nr:hypothetical protein [Deltaproteobacteria bacterium]
MAKAVGTAALVMAGIWGFDRLMLVAEARGYVYWRRKKPSPGTVGTALMEVQSIFEPGKEHTVKEVREEETEEDDSGDPPDLS